MAPSEGKDWPWRLLWNAHCHIWRMHCATFGTNRSFLVAVISSTIFFYLFYYYYYCQMGYKFQSCAQILSSSDS